MTVALAKSADQGEGWLYPNREFASNEQAEAIPNWPEVESALKNAGKDIPLMSELATFADRKPAVRRGKNGN